MVQGETPGWQLAPTLECQRQNDRDRNTGWLRNIDLAYVERWLILHVEDLFIATCACMSNQRYRLTTGSVCFGPIDLAGIGHVRGVNMIV
jgi:hypothetical protein